jgi:hypothetical protein
MSVTRRNAELRCAPNLTGGVPAPAASSKAVRTVAMKERIEMASNDRAVDPRKTPTVELLRKMIASGKSIPSRPGTH